MHACAYVFVTLLAVARGMDRAGLAQFQSTSDFIPNLSFQVLLRLLRSQENELILEEKLKEQVCIVSRLRVSIFGSAAVVALDQLRWILSTLVAVHSTYQY
jgi:hypothetical protein